MRNFLFWVGYTSILHAVIFFSSQAGAVEKKKVIIGSIAACPYFCDEQKQNKKGYLQELLTEIFDNEKYHVQFQFVPAPRLIPMLRLKKFDLIILPTAWVRYESGISILKPSLGYSHLALVKNKKEKFEFVSAANLDKKSLALLDMGQESSVIVSNISKEAPNAKIDVLTGEGNSQRIVQMVKYNRIDMAVGDYNMLKYEISKSNEKDLEIIETSLAGFSFWNLVVNSKDASVNSYSATIESSVEKLRGNGVFQKIIKKYGIKDWSQF